MVIVEFNQTIVKGQRAEYRISRPAHVYYNHCVSLSVFLSACPLAFWKMQITLEPRDIF